MIQPPMTLAHSPVSRVLTSWTVVSLAICLLSLAPSTSVHAASHVRTDASERHVAASLDKELNKLAATENGELLDTATDNEMYGKVSNYPRESGEEESLLNDVEGVYGPEKPHLLENKTKLRYNKRFRGSKRRLRGSKRRQATGEDVDSAIFQEDAGSAPYEREHRKPRLRFVGSDLRKRSASLSPWKHVQEVVADDLEEQQRHRRSILPEYRTINKRVPIGNDLQALADLLYMTRQRQEYEKFREEMEKIGKR